MIEDNEQLYILAQNIESAYFRIAKLRQDLLDSRCFDEWVELVYASGTLSSAIERLADMLRREEE